MSQGSSNQYQKLTRGDQLMTSSPRLYHMTSVLGTFEVNEVKSEYRSLATVNNLCFDQSLLYQVEQPGKSSLKTQPCNRRSQPNLYSDCLVVCNFLSNLFRIYNF